MGALSAIVPVHNGGRAFERCLQGLANATPPPDEIIVVADGESDDAGRLAARYGARVIKNEHARGPAHARNQGARVASGDVLFFVDADVAIRPETIGCIHGVFSRYPSLSALIGSYDDAPGERDFLSQYRNLLHHHTHQTAREETSTFWGACGAVRREAFFSVGGFDESYRHPSVEDIELGYRLRQAGCSIRLCKEIQVKHLKRWCAASLIKTDVFRRALPWTELILRYRTFEKDLSLGTAQCLSVVSVFALLGALFAACWYPSSWLLAALFCMLFFVLNAPFFSFLRRSRGLLFAAAAVPWHGLFYAYSGFGFLLGATRYAFQVRPPVHARRAEALRP